MKLRDIHGKVSHHNGGFFIGESPELIGDGDWELYKPDVNLNFYNTLMDKYPKKIGTYNGLSILRKRGQFFAVAESKKDAPLVYWIKTEVNRLSAINSNGITQRALWRNTNIPGTVGIQAYVFFSVLLPEYHVIVTDGQQTNSGKTFWVNRATEAIKSNLNVYLLHELDPRKLFLIRDIDTFSSLIEEGQVWGTSPVYKHRKLIISDHELTAGNGIEAIT